MGDVVIDTEMILPTELGNTELKIAFFSSDFKFLVLPVEENGAFAVSSGFCSHSHGSAPFSKPKNCNDQTARRSTRSLPDLPTVSEKIPWNRGTWVAFSSRKHKEH
nr:PREDICTED: uncharacterized protein LOC105663690 [Megachile rotundata]